MAFRSGVSSLALGQTTDAVRKSIMKLISGTAHPTLAADIATSLETRLVDMSVSSFPDGETSVKINENVRGEDIFIIQPTCPPTNHNIMAEGSKRTETAVWIVNEKVDLNDSLDLGTDSALLKVEVETGRITVGLIDGVANSIDVNIEGVAAEIPTVAKPVAPPFALSPPGPLAAKGPR